MGVRGLTTYINHNNETFLQTFFLHDSQLIIDGHSLCSQLYCRRNSFSAFGGDYDKYASDVRNFFKNLRKCKISAYVIFDGSHERRKLKTIYSRLRAKITGASKLDFVTQGSLQIFPLLLRDVFVAVLEELSIPYTVCEFEADDEIAAMARYLNCPVLSYDSDFFIYNVIYLPFNKFEIKPRTILEGGNKINVMECKIYKVEYLTKHFKIKEELLPLLATLLGNDYVEKKVFNKFFSQLKLPKSKSMKNEQQRSIHGLFQWFQNETLDSAIDKIIDRLKKPQKGKVLSILKKSIEGYNAKTCRSLEYFNITTEITPDESIKLPDKLNSLKDDDTIDGEATSEIEEDSGGSPDEASNDEAEISKANDTMVLPEWFSEAIRTKRIPKSHINLYTHHLYLCNPQAEDYNDTDSFLHNLPILRYIFDLMTDFSEEYCIYVSREKDSNYKRVFVNQEYAIPRMIDINFSELSKEQLNQCFHHFLKQKMELLDMSLIQLLPPNFQLTMISILWWVATCKVPIGHVHSILMSYIMLEVIDDKTGMPRGHFQFMNKYSKKIEELKITPKPEIDENDLYLNKNKVQYEDCLIAASALLKHFEMDEKIQKRPKTYDSKKMHSFAQFQCSLMQFNSLNTLCGCPFESTKYSKTFNGTFVYNISLRLENQTVPYNFFEQYLQGATTVLMFYMSLFTIFDQLVEKMKIKTVQAIGKRRKRKSVDL